MVTIFSGRMYEEELNKSICLAVDETIYLFSLGLYHSYNLHFEKEYENQKYLEKLKTLHKKEWIQKQKDVCIKSDGSLVNEKGERYQFQEESLHLLTKKYLECDTYYANSITQLAKGKLSSQKELTKDYISNKEAVVKSIDKKIRSEKDKLAGLEKTLLNLYEYRKELFSNPNSKQKLKVSHYKNISSDGFTITVRTLKNKHIVNKEYGLFEFEYEYLLPNIRKLRNKIGMLTFRRNRILFQIEQLKIPKRIVFGGKYSLKKYTHDELRSKKYREFTISGRSDAKYGNFVFKMTPVGDTFDIRVTLLDKKEYLFSKVKFPYLGNELRDILTLNTPAQEMIPICIGIVRKVDARGKTYYQFKVSFDLSVTKRVNTDSSNGIIGADFNVGHIDWTETDRNGNLIDYGKIEYKVDGTSHENKVSLRKAVNELGELIKEKKKPLSVEKLDTANSKKQSTYRDKKTNQIIHSLPFSLFLQMVEYAGLKYGFEVRKVNPAYTSIIGKLKYSDEKKLNTHTSASFCIARRGMFYHLKEPLPKKYKPLLSEKVRLSHHWKQYHLVNKKLQKEAKKQPKENKQNVIVDNSKQVVFEVIETK